MPDLNKNKQLKVSTAIGGLSALAATGVTQASADVTPVGATNNNGGEVVNGKRVSSGSDLKVKQNGHWYTYDNLGNIIQDSTSNYVSNAPSQTPGVDPSKGQSTTTSGTATSGGGVDPSTIPSSTAGSVTTSNTSSQSATGSTVASQSSAASVSQTPSTSSVASQSQAPASQTPESTSSTQTSQTSQSSAPVSQSMASQSQPQPSLTSHVIPPAVSVVTSQTPSSTTPTSSAATSSNPVSENSASSQVVSQTPTSQAPQSTSSVQTSTAVSQAPQSQAPVSQSVITSQAPQSQTPVSQSESQSQQGSLITSQTPSQAPDSKGNTYITRYVDVNGNTIIPDVTSTSGFVNNADAVENMGYGYKHFNDVLSTSTNSDKSLTQITTEVFIPLPEHKHVYVVKVQDQNGNSLGPDTVDYDRFNTDNVENLKNNGYTTTVSKVNISTDKFAVQETQTEIVTLVKQGTTVTPANKSGLGTIHYVTNYLDTNGNPITQPATSTEGFVVGDDKIEHMNYGYKLVMIGNITTVSNDDGSVTKSETETYAAYPEHRDVWISRVQDQDGNSLGQDTVNYDGFDIHNVYTLTDNGYKVVNAKYNTNADQYNTQVTHLQISVLQKVTKPVNTVYVTSYIADDGEQLSNDVTNNSAFAPAIGIKSYVFDKNEDTSVTNADGVVTNTRVIYYKPANGVNISYITEYHDEDDNQIAPDSTKTDDFAQPLTIKGYSEGTYSVNSYPNDDGTVIVKILVYNYKKDASQTNGQDAVVVPNTTNNGTNTNTNKTYSIFAIGDSTAAGYNPYNDGAKSYDIYAAQDLNNSPVNMDSAIGGKHITDMNDLVTTAINNSAFKNATDVVINLGVNDINYGDGTNINTLMQIYQDNLTRLHNANPNVKIHILLPLSNYLTVMNRTNSTIGTNGFNMYDLRQQLTNLGNQMGVDVINTWDIVNDQNHATTIPDGAHPTNATYQALGQKIAQAIQNDNVQWTGTTQNYAMNDTGYFNTLTGWRWLNAGKVGNGFQSYMGTYYWFDNGVRSDNAWHQAWGHTYYTGSDGKAVQGTQVIDGKSYYFGDDGTYYMR